MPDHSPIEVSTTVDEKDLKAFKRAALRQAATIQPQPGDTRKRFMPIAGATVFYLAYLWTGQQSLVADVVWSFIEDYPTSLLCSVVIFYFVTSWYIRVISRRNERLVTPVPGGIALNDWRYDYDYSGITKRRPGVELGYAWPAFMQACETADHFFLVLDPGRRSCSQSGLLPIQTSSSGSARLPRTKSARFGKPNARFRQIRAVGSLRRRRAVFFDERRKRHSTAW